jgi:hypothetical protein
MASTILVNSIKAQSGTEVEVPTGFILNVADTGALKVNDVAITAGSSNIARKTADYTVLEADVSGKSELVITCNASASNRIITLPAVATSGLSTCIITIVADADATSTYELKVQDSASAEVWTGYQKNDFVRLVVSNSVWVVLDHKETYYSHRYLAADLSIAASANTKLITWTNNSEIGNTWDNPNNKLLTPTGMNGYWTINYNLAGNGNYFQICPYLVIGGTTIIKFNVYGATGQGYNGYGSTSIGGHYYATSTQAVEFYGSNYCTDTVSYTTGYVVGGGNLSETHFVAQFNRVY